MVVNGREYPIWGALVEGKKHWIGRTLRDVDEMFGNAPDTKIKDVRLEPNGTDSAILIFEGEDYTCSCDVGYLSIELDGCPGGWVRFNGYGGHYWLIHQTDESNKPDKPIRITKS